MARRLLSRQGGFVHDINAVASLSDEPDNIRLLSDRSLYILQNLSQAEITFLSRYGTIETGDFYLPVQSGSPEESDVEDAIDLIRRDLNSMAIDELLECICAQLTGLVEIGKAEGQDIESPESGGQVSVGEGEQFPTQSAYYDAKCNVSNAIYDTVRNAVLWLDTNGADLIAGGFGGVTSGLLVSFAIAGPVGWAVVVAVSAISAIAGYLIAYNLSFDDLYDALVDVHDECVLALYNAANTATAEQQFVAAIAGSSVSTTVLERGAINLILTSDALNQLFDPREDVASYQSPSPVDCGGFVLQIWTFPTDLESWTFTDESDPSCSASQSYNAGDEAIQNELVVASLPNVTAIAENNSPTVSLAITPGASVQADYDAPSDAPSNHAVLIRTHYSDATSEETSFQAFNSPGTFVQTLTMAKTITSVDVSMARSTSGSALGSTSQQNILEVRIIGI